MFHVSSEENDILCTSPRLASLPENDIFETVLDRSW
jgi:hypothetical protein